MKKYLITCGLPYSNGYLHVGHIAGAYLPGDIFTRYQRLIGRDVRFVCGSDDHGVPVKLTADEQGKDPKEVAKFYNKQQETDFNGLGIHFDVYGTTCQNEYHIKTSQDLFLNLYDKGYFNKKVTKQFFDPESEMFLPDRYVKGTCGYCGAKDQNSDQCEECGKQLDIDHLNDAYSIITKAAADIKDTAHWFLDLTQFEDIIAKWIEQADVRDHTKNFVKGLISTGLVERAITRDLDWGISVPIDDPDAKNKVLYVWFDAPIGYISNTKEACQSIEGDSEKYTDWWKSEDCEIYHFIGEDNTVFHCIIWIAMLHAEGSFQLPKGVIANQFLNIKFPDKEEEKISKSRGTAIWINEYLAAGGNPDSLRYYINSIAPEKARSVFNPEDLIQKHNSELGNALGNFVNRVCSFYQKHYGQEVAAINDSLSDDRDNQFNQERIDIVEQVGELVNDFAFKAAQEKLFEYIRSCNAYINEKEPWSTRKDSPELAQNTLLHCLNAIHTISILLSPFLPFTSDKIIQILGTSKEFTWSDAKSALVPGQTMQKPEILFEKIESLEELFS